MTVRSRYNKNNNKCLRNCFLGFHVYNKNNNNSLRNCFLGFHVVFSLLDTNSVVSFYQIVLAPKNHDTKLNKAVVKWPR